MLRCLYVPLYQGTETKISGFINGICPTDPNLIIPEYCTNDTEYKVTELASYGICNCNSIKSIFFSKSIKRLQSYSCLNLNNLGGIEFEEGSELQRIEQNVFGSTGFWVTEHNTFDLVLPDTLQYIGNMALFTYWLRSVTFCGSTILVENNAFHQHYPLVYVSKNYKSALFGKLTAIRNDERCPLEPTEEEKKLQKTNFFVLAIVVITIESE